MTPPPRWIGLADYVPDPPYFSQKGNTVPAVAKSTTTYTLRDFEPTAAGLAAAIIDAYDSAKKVIPDPVLGSVTYSEPRVDPYADATTCCAHIIFHAK